MKTILITGVSRGLGLGIATSYLETGSRVVGTLRTENQEISKLMHRFPETLKLIHWEAGEALSTSQLDQIEESFWPEDANHFDLIISNAGYKPMDPSRFPEDLRGDDMLEAFKINVVGPLELVKALVPKWSNPSTKVVHISTSIASLTQPMAGYATAYATSKAALNMLSLHLRPWLLEQIYDFLLLHPGWVKTDMGGDRAPLTIKESVQGMIRVIESHQPKDPFFLDYLGNALPW